MRAIEFAHPGPRTKPFVIRAVNGNGGHIGRNQARISIGISDPTRAVKFIEGCPLMRQSNTNRWAAKRLPGTVSINRSRNVSSNPLVVINRVNNDDCRFISRWARIGQIVSGPTAAIKFNHSQVIYTGS